MSRCATGAIQWLATVRCLQENAPTPLLHVFIDDETGDLQNFKRKVKDDGQSIVAVRVPATGYQTSLGQLTLAQTVWTIRNFMESSS